ncbi:MAG: tetratricopeptide repeat-containing sensor histidine kinase [Bacteroidales bacterium]|nr:tetratricopeptide repeat-containing sensor histidine kinase [Bacteroidales bacterium]
MLKRKTAYIIIFLIISSSSSGQTAVTDSIMDLISGQPDSLKLLNLKNHALAEQYRSLKTGLAYADKRMEIAMEINEPRAIAETHHIYGNLYSTSGLHNDARENYLKALALFDSLSLHEDRASILHNLGLVSFRQKDTLKSIEYYRRSIDLRKKYLEDRRTGDELTTLGEAYLAYKQYDKSQECLLEALEYYSEIKGYPRKMETYAFLFDNCYATGQSNCKRWADSMTTENKILSSSVYASMICLRLARYNIIIDRPDISAAYIDSINFDMLHHPEVIDPVDVLNELSEQYRNKGNQGKAIQYSLLYRKQKDKQIEREVQELVSNYNIRLGIIASEEEIAWSQKQNELILKRIEIERIISLIIYLALVITIFVLIYTLLSLNSIRRTNRKLNARRSGLQEAYERSSRYKERILSIRENKNNFFSIVSLKLSKPFTGLMSSLSVISTYLDKNNKDLKLKTMMENLYKDASIIEKGLERILLWSKLQRNKYILEYDTFNLNEFMHGILPSLLGISLKKDIRIRFDIDPEIIIRFDRFSLKTIIMILAENSIEHSSPRSDVIIRAQKGKQGCILSVTDFGSGIPAAEQNKIFDIDKIKDKNSADGNKIGLGLLIAKIMAEKNNSTISLESKEKSGTTIYIHIKESHDG